MMEKWIIMKKNKEMNIEKQINEKWQIMNIEKWINKWYSEK